MKYYLLVILIVISECLSIWITDCPNVKNPMSLVRKRRHLVFPEGSNAILTASLVKAFMTHAPAGWNIALEIDVLFPLPNANFTRAHSRRKLHHSQKRELWDRLKNSMNFYNFNGQACILKSICEAKFHLASPGKSLVHDVLRAIFTAPVFEEAFEEEIRGSYDEILDPEFCEKFTDCPVSLVNFISTYNNTMIINV
ncbi:uncharacterized protein LOC128676121 [Plodia interpunctella]|uniref:uncharacterized protein LOC128676121 n=1 Tax=Plodia interpunctella TaxID=58824 RepID=UPI0023682CB4|nr:uncharacterized protein LOC128676121 [Plodia interpunctella]